MIQTDEWLGRVWQQSPMSGRAGAERPDPSVFGYTTALAHFRLV